MNKRGSRAQLLAGVALLLVAIVAVYVLFFWPVASTQPPLPAALDGTAPEYAITRLPLAGALTDSDAEISGLAWYNDIRTSAQPRTLVLA